MGLPGGRVRVVYDCMVFLQGAARSTSPAGLCLRLAEKGFVELCLSEAILSEVGEVLRRPKVRAKFPTLTDELVSQFLHVLKGFSTFFEDVTLELAFARDPKDEPCINHTVESVERTAIVRKRC
jgi:putative PIN family toxin of toxin-antitoxin system